MTSSWWSQKLSGEAPAAPAAPAYVPSPPMPRPQVYTPPTTLPGRPVMTPAVPQQPLKAASARMSGYCPSCMSGNYMPSAPGSTRMRCYDCGYPVVQSTSGLSGGGGESSGPTQAAQQVASGGYNPQNIIGRVG